MGEGNWGEGGWGCVAWIWNFGRWEGSGGLGIRGAVPRVWDWFVDCSIPIPSSIETDKQPIA